jgi:hypothetical protein
VAPATAAVSSQESATTGVATSLNVTHPTGLSDNELVIIVSEVVRNGGGAVTWTGPSGFVQRGADQALSSGTIELTVWTKDITNAAGEGTWTASVSHGGTAPTTANLAAIAVRITGAEAGANITVAFTIENVAVASFTPPSITIDENDTLVICGVVAARPGTWTSPSGYTELADIVTTGNAAANESALCMADGDALEAAGTEAPGAFTYSQTRQGISYTIAVGPAAGGTTHTESYAGAVTPTGVPVKQTAKSTAGAATPTGSTVRQIDKPAAGTVEASATLVREVEQFLAGLTVPTGTTASRVDVSLAGGTTPAAVLVNASVKVLSIAGAVAPVSTLVKLAALTLTGATTPTGSTSKTVATSLAGSVAPVGVRAGLVSKLIAGAVTAAGVLANELVGVTNNTHGPVTLALLHSARLADSPHEAAVSTRHAAGRLHV